MRFKLFFLFLLSALGILGIGSSVLSAQNLRVNLHISERKWVVGEEYRISIEAASTQEGTFSSPQFTESPLFKLEFEEQTSKSFIEEEQVYYSSEFLYRLKALQEGEVYFSPRLEWSKKGEKLFQACPPAQILLRIEKRATSLWIWAIGGALLFGMVLLLSHRWLRRRKEARKNLPQERVEERYLRELSLLSRFRMEGDFKSYFAGLERLYESWHQEPEKTDIPEEYVSKMQGLKNLSQEVRFASREVFPQEWESYTHYLQHLLENHHAQKRKK
jgi:hypothetical protein